MDRDMLSSSDESSFSNVNKGKNTIDETKNTVKRRKRRKKIGQARPKKKPVSKSSNNNDNNITSSNRRNTLNTNTPLPTNNSNNANQVSRHNNSTLLATSSPHLPHHQEQQTPARLIGNCNNDNIVSPTPNANQAVASLLEAAAKRNQSYAALRSVGSNSQLLRPDLQRR